MAADSYGTKNEPQFAGGGAPSDASDLTTVAAYAADVGNRKVRTNAQRTALSGKDLWVGLEVHESDTNTDWLYSSAGWRMTFQDPGWTALTPNSGWTVTSGDALEARALNRVGFLSGRINATAGAGNAALTLPVGLRPHRQVVVGLTATDGPLTRWAVVIDTAGVVNVIKGATAVGDLPLSGIPPFPLA